MKRYLDADILIGHLRNFPAATELLRTLSANGPDLWIAAYQRMEILAYMRPAEEARTVRLLARLQTQPLTEPIVDLAAQLFRQFNPSHGVDEGDAILAATALSTNGVIYTQNIKHYPMPGLRVERGWET